MEMLIRNPIYPDPNFDCNNKNIHEYAPYIIRDGVHIIDNEWWLSLNQHCRDLISARADFILDKVDIPHDFQFDDDSKFITKVYKSYIDAFDYQCWFPNIAHLDNVPSGVVILPISQELKDIFVRMYNHETIESDILDEFKERLRDSMIGGRDYFVRLSSTSGKNIKSVRPFNNIDDIITHITSHKLFVEQEYKREKDSCLILIPWNDDIDDRFEFRIFVVDGKLTGASQQNVRKLYHYTSGELEMIEHALNNISFLNQTSYKTYVADVYCLDGVCKLIELNPFGAHSGAGSSLFHWITDYEVLHGNQPAQLRYLSVINY